MHCFQTPFQAIEFGHSTSTQVAHFCASLAPPPRVLALTHVSPRYRLQLDAGGGGSDSVVGMGPRLVSELIAECVATLRGAGVAAVVDGDAGSSPPQQQQQSSPTTRVLMASDMLVLDAKQAFRRL